MTRYVVIVYPAPPATRSSGSISSKSTDARKVTTLAARTPESAAQTVGVPAGGYALVFEETKASRFDRAAIAPLEQKMPDGNPLPQAATVADCA